MGVIAGRTSPRTILWYASALAWVVRLLVTAEQVSTAATLRL
jgi:hypothetical protein